MIAVLERIKRELRPFHWDVRKSFHSFAPQYARELPRF